MNASTGDVPGRIFMSYRREDTAFPAGWLYDRLADRFGRDQVFKDIDSIELGDDFIEVITTAVGSCDVLLTLIGGQWLTITGQDGRRRLDNSDDFVRLEIEAALERNVRVIPILVDGAQMPRADELPPSLAKLWRLQALDLSPSRFDVDTQRLLRVLDRTVAEAQEQARRKAEEAAAVRRRQVEQLQGQLRERSAVQDWEAVVAASEELAALDPAAADPDGLASAAREQITRRQEAEKAAAARRRREAVAARRRQEAERKAREEAERKAREEAERKAREKAERKAREEGLLRFTTQLLSLKNATLREYSRRPGLMQAFTSDIRGELLSALDNELTRGKLLSALGNKPTRAEVVVNLSAVENIDINLSDTSRVTKKTCSSTDSAPGPLFGTKSTGRGLLAITDRRLILAFAGPPEIPDSDRGSLLIYDSFRLADPVVPINPTAKGTDFVISQLEISYREISKVEEVRSQSRSYGLTGPRMVLSLSLTKFSLDRNFSLPTMGSLSLSFYGFEARQRGVDILAYIRRARGELSL